MNIYPGLSKVFVEYRIALNFNNIIYYRFSKDAKIKNNVMCSIKETFFLKLLNKNSHHYSNFVANHICDDNLLCGLFPPCRPPFFLVVKKKGSTFGSFKSAENR